MKLLTTTLLALPILAITAADIDIPVCTSPSDTTYPTLSTYNTAANTFCRDIIFRGQNEYKVDRLRWWFTTLKTADVNTRGMVFELGQASEAHKNAIITLDECIKGFTARTQDVIKKQWEPCFLQTAKKGEKVHVIKDWHGERKKEGFGTVEFQVFPYMSQTDD